MHNVNLTPFIPSQVLLTPPISSCPATVSSTFFSHMSQAVGCSLHYVLPAFSSSSRLPDCFHLNENIVRGKVAYYVISTWSSTLLRE